MFRFMLSCVLLRVGIMRAYCICSSTVLVRVLRVFCACFSAYFACVLLCIPLFRPLRLRRTGKKREISTGNLISSFAECSCFKVSHLRWTGIPSRGSSNTPGFMLQKTWLKELRHDILIHFFDGLNCELLLKCGKT